MNQHGTADFYENLFRCRCMLGSLPLPEPKLKITFVQRGLYFYTSIESTYIHPVQENQKKRFVTIVETWICFSTSRTAFQSARKHKSRPTRSQPVIIDYLKHSKMSTSKQTKDFSAHELCAYVYVNVNIFAPIYSAAVRLLNHY